ncbi:MAG: hypothetical protein K2X27_14670 [Candidatus Obscuribacterales bacterium]|nr:hypothetical protein [Candidatus Obscuribacterales bacterium]
MDLAAKQNAVAKIIDGQVIDDSDRVAVCVKGTVNGFPAHFEAFMTGWPFGVTYVVESRLPDEEEKGYEQAKINIVPRMGQGFFSFFAHILLFEGKGMSVNDKRLERKLIFSYDSRDAALRAVKYPGIPETLLILEEDCKLKELIIKTEAGVCFSQAVSFQDLDLDLCSATFNYLGQIAQVLHDLF